MTEMIDSYYIENVMTSMNLNYNINNEVVVFVHCLFDACLYTSQRTYTFLYMCTQIFGNGSLSILFLYEVDKNGFMFPVNVV